MPLVKVPELALDLINDALEYHSHAIVTGMDTNEDDVVEHWGSLRYFWKITKNVQPEFGRIYHRCRLAELVMYACRMHPFGSLEPGTDIPGDEQDEPMAMVYWTPGQWDVLRVKLLELNQTVKREDANKFIRNDEDERPSTRVVDKEQQKKLKDILDRIVINKHLSHIRLKMEKWCRSDSRKQPPIDLVDLNNFWEDILALRDEKKDLKKFAFLRQFLARDSKTSQPKLAPMDDLEPILRSSNCDLEMFAADLLSLIMDWNRELFQNKEPALYRIGYGDPNNEPFIQKTRAVYESDEGESSDEEEEARHHKRHQNRSGRSNGRVRTNNCSDLDERKPPARSSPKEMRDIRIARAALRQSAPDPLEEACEAAEEAAAGKDPRTQGSGRQSTVPHSPLRNEREDRAPVHAPAPAAAAASSEHDEEETDEDRILARHLSRRMERQKRARSSQPHEEAESTENTFSNRRAPHDSSRRQKRSRDDEEYNSEITDPDSRAGVRRTSEGTPKRRRKDKYDKKKSAHRIIFSDSEDDNEALNSVLLSDLPAFRTTSPRRPMHSSNRRKSSGQKQRKFWSKEEKAAVREGIRKFGDGKWRQIQEEFIDILGSRSNVQIKDCARTMRKSGEL